MHDKKAKGGNKSRLRGLIGSSKCTNSRILVYTISCLAPDAMKIGDSFVVCDAGGGTVDLIS